MYGRPQEALNNTPTHFQPSTELNNPIIVAPVDVAAAALARLAFDPLLKSDGSYLFFAIAVVIAALYGGKSAGLLRLF